MSGPPFPASVTPPGRRAPEWARVSFLADAIVAVTDAAEHRLEYVDAVVTSGGMDGDVVFCRSRSSGLEISSSAEGFLAALAAASGGALGAQVDVAAARVVRRRWLGRASVASFLGFFVVLGVLAWQAPAVLAWSVDLLPTSVDRRLGDAATAELATQGARVASAEADAFLAEVMARLEPHAAVAGFEYRVSVVESDEVNAFALPGGQMVVNTGLLRAADSPEEVAGVMAHEMAHVSLRHGMRNVAHHAGTALALSLLLGDAEGWVELAAGVAVIAQQNDYSREQETAADAEGVRMMRLAGIDPRGLTRFFARLEQQPGAELEGSLAWLSTHPDHRSRIEHVEALVRELPGAPPRPFTVDWPALQRSLSR